MLLPAPSDSCYITASACVFLSHRLNDWSDVCFLLYFSLSYWLVWDLGGRIAVTDRHRAAYPRVWGGNDRWQRKALHRCRCFKGSHLALEGSVLDCFAFTFPKLISPQCGEPPQPGLLGKFSIYPGTLNSEGVVSIFQPCITFRSQRHLFFHWRIPSQSQPSVKRNHLFVPSLPSRSSVLLASFQLGFQTLIEEPLLARRHQICPPAPAVEHFC